MYKLFNDFDRKVSKGRKYLGEEYIKIFSKIIRIFSKIIKIFSKIIRIFSKIIKIFSKLRTQKIRKTHIKSS
ncbi:hypothetical protein [Methanosarcina mazei]|mgnify:CR=1 FL=1|jgi:hypothetical protein|uniref:Uncharacterized protein n=4 Tax=Methanosarcina mazei TaxID=2209 RepID=A0A0F8EX55_METMZ|nr:hypothetical protein [Methanosarcina mazei]AKB40176.1 hypothetical protein MSMAW_1185 [Methanosarcina mazei WWM610]AKB67739.1 hypothetical protein MSMAL_1196 [Methanosarcina mazei LYC]AKB72444.1 hypothetical protein MSMAC_2554 [Methanosarcina mazei C16]KKG06179.1 hypothetical protein DU47_13095 [Methanosarcina mazei]KKG12415.1 hypothetical protein DU34_15825 [Methanosarcina mazei]